MLSDFSRLILPATYTRWLLFLVLVFAARSDAVSLGVAIVGELDSVVSVSSLSMRVDGVRIPNNKS